MRKSLFFLPLLVLSISGLWYVQAQEKGQPHLLRLEQRKHDAEVKQRTHDQEPPELVVLGAKGGAGERRPPQLTGEKAPSAVRPKKEPTDRDKLALAWKYYKQGRYDRAIPLFSAASSSPHRPTALEAKLGLAYSYIKKGEAAKAEPLMAELVRERYKLDQTLPGLLSLLLEKGEEERARPYMALLPPDEKASWEKKLREAKIRRDFQKMRKPAGARDWKEFARTHEEELKSCLAPDVFLQVAQGLQKAGEKEQAAKLFRDLLPCTKDDWKMRAGVLSGLAKTLAAEEAIKEIQKEKGKGPAPYRQQVSSLELAVRKKQLQGLPPGSPEAGGVAREILALDPRDPAAQRALAWMYYNQGNYAEAERIFSSLHKRFPAERDYALGLIYSQMKLGKIDAALALAEKMKFQDLEWQKIRSQLYLQKATAAYERGDYREADSFLAKLLAIDPANQDAKNLLAWVRYQQGREKQALAIIHEARDQKSPSYESRLKPLELLILRKELDSLPPSSPQVERTARTILKIEPDDPAAQRALAWMYYNQGNYAEAERIFSSLHKRFPAERDYALGLAYTQIKLGKMDEALALADRVKFQDEEWRRIRAQLYLQKATDAYARGNFREAELFLSKLLEIEPGNHDGKVLMSWVLYQQGRYEEALPGFLEEYQKSPSPNLGGPILSMYERKGETRKAFQFAETLGKEPSAASKKTAAEFFSRHRAPIRAAQTDLEPCKPCYANAGKPSLDFSFFYRYKSGDDGFSKLTETSFPITLDLPVRYGKKWTFSLIPTYLNSGSAPSFPYGGSYYRFLNGDPKVQDWETSLRVWKPELGFESEGAIKYGFLLGSSFFNAPVNPLPTFIAGATGESWLLQVHQQQVDESILSYAGQQDPYRDQTWGRVLRAGIEGEIRFVPLPSYWVTFTGGYDYFYGQDVWSNQGVWGNGSFGKTIAFGPGDLSLGLFATAKHFQRNTNFFTFGHGGYFSPEIFFMTGPTARFQTPSCSTSSLDARLSFGYLYYQTRESPHYPLLGGGGSGLNPSAQTDAAGTYAGENRSKLGINGRLRGVKLLGDRWIGSGFVSFNNSSGYNEWRAGVSLQFFFDRICNVGEFRHFLKRHPFDLP